MVMIGASLGAVIGMTLFATRFWPLIPMTIEGRFGARCIQEALTTTRTNLLTSFLMVIALIFCIGVGFSLVGLGLPIAIPFTALTLVAALRMMEGRSIPAFEQDAP